MNGKPCINFGNIESVTVMRDNYVGFVKYLIEFTNQSPIVMRVLLKDREIREGKAFRLALSLIKDGKGEEIGVSDDPYSVGFIGSPRGYD